MGFFDSIKKATGVGLTPDQHFERAYEKGVLLGESEWKNSIKLFENAAKKAEEGGRDDLALRASASAELYRFVTDKDFDALKRLGTSLRSMEQIEQPGSRSETWEAAPLAAEIEARVIEARIGGVSKSKHAELSAVHKAAAGAFKKIFTQPLITYSWLADDAHTETAQARFFYHSALGAWHDSVTQVATSPEGAAEHMAKALNFFRQCNDEAWAERSETWLQGCRVKRHCWVCNREFQGESLHFHHKKAYIAPYVAAIMEQRGEDLSVFDRATGSIVVCNPCATGIENIADRVATQRVAELRSEVEVALKSLNATVANNATNIDHLDGRLRRVERHSHSH
jgi:hypothetical protein